MFGVIGVGSKVDIEHRKTILACPFESLIYPSTFETEEPELYAQVMKECPQMLTDPDLMLDREQILLALFLIIEHNKGRASKWYPYLISLPQEQQFFCDWDPKYLKAMQDPKLSQITAEYRD